MYTMTMAPDMSQTHVGFYVLCVCVAIVLYASIRSMLEDGVGPISIGTTVAMILLLCFGGYVSFFVEEPPPANTPVTAKFLRYQPEEQRYSCGSSKSPSTCYTNKMFGVFEVPEGTVILEVSKSSPMPAYVTLYKN